MKCPICSGDNATIVENNVPFPVRHSEFSFLRCRDCDHIAIMPPLSDHFSGQDYIRDNTSEVVDVSKRTSNRVAKVVALNTDGRPRVVCDIGAGNCAFTRAFSQLGWDAYAVDVERFDETYEKFVPVDQLSDWLGKNEVGVFFSNHCFEHIELDELRDLCSKFLHDIKQGGVGFFVVPCAKFSLVDNEIYLEEFVYGHKNIFSKKSAEIFFSGIFTGKAGYTVDVQFIRARGSFLGTRLNMMVTQLARFRMDNFLRLVLYVANSMVFGAEDEISVLVRKSPA